MKFATYFSLALCGTLLMTGCAAKNASSTQEATTAPTTLASWLAQAPTPQTVQCSVAESVAPDAVAKFNAISEKVASIYSTVYTYAGSEKSEVTLPSVDAATVTEAVQAALTSDSGDLGTTVRATVTETYQSTMAEIEAQQKSITDYISSLRSNASIEAISDPLQKTATLFQLGSNVKALEEQLAEAAQGASLILREAVTPSATQE